MDLYRTLRISLYLLAGTGAFAISVAERSFFFLILIAVLGVLSYLTIDRAKLKPLSAEVTAVSTLILLYLALRPLHDDEHWQAHFPAAVAHFLCAWQGLLFFSVYGGPILLTYCGSSLAVVVMSGVVQSGPSLVVRVACFLVVAVWTLYIHSVWRSRQEFAGLPALMQGGEPVRKETGASDSTSFNDVFKRLPPGAFWNTLKLVAGMTAACIALGIAIFFSAPRLDSIMALIDSRGTSGEKSTELRPFQASRESSPTPKSGFSEGVNVKDIGNITPDLRVALKVTFSKPIELISGKRETLLLKGLNLSEYRNGEWIPETIRDTIEARPGAPISPLDLSLDGPVYHGQEIEQTVESISLTSPDYFAAGPVEKLQVRTVETDSEGSLRNPGGDKLERYTLTITAPFDAARLTDGMIAEHHQLQRYVRQNGLPPVERERVSQLALQITRHSRSARAKASDIQQWLAEHKKYSMNLQAIHAVGDPVAHFILTNDPQQARGHCGLFASAFVLLCRANDLPARLCTGYALRLNPGSKENKTAIAYNSDAHGWAEIYFKGVGWVAFDPTPPEGPEDNPVAAASPTPVNKTPPTSANDSALNDKDPSRGFVQDWWDNLLKFNGYEQRKLYEKLSGTSRDLNATSSGRGWMGWLGAVLAWVLAAGAIGWLVQVFARRNTRRKYAASAGGARSRAAVAFYNDLLHALSRRGYSRRPGQTPREFADAVIRRGGESFAPVRAVTDIFEAVRYGGDELQQDEFNRLQDALDKIREMTF